MQANFRVKLFESVSSVFVEFSTEQDVKMKILLFLMIVLAFVGLSYQNPQRQIQFKLPKGVVKPWAGDGRGRFMNPDDRDK